MNKKSEKLVLNLQKNELTGHLISKKLAIKWKGKNKKILEHISLDELDHYKTFKKITNKDVSPDKFKVFIYTLLSSIFGLSFGLKLMKRNLNFSKDKYKKIKSNKELRKIINNKERHEVDLLNLIREERVEYAGYIVLGLNDALVELSGALAGLTLALQNSRLIAIIGLITGIAAALSMAASGYLSSKEEKNSKKPLKSALYTGVTYLVTVFLLVTPYFLIENIFVSLLVMLITVISIIAGYTFYITTAKNLSFKKKFFEMTTISLSVAVISFIIGYFLRRFE